MILYSTFLYIDCVCYLFWLDIYKSLFSIVFFYNSNIFHIFLPFYYTNFFSELIYVTLNLNPFPCLSDSFWILLPAIYFKILAVACPIFGFLLFAPTAILITGTGVFTSNLRKESHAFLTSFDSFFYVIYKSCSFELKLIRCESDLFLTFTIKIETHIVKFKYITLVI